MNRFITAIAAVATLVATPAFASDPAKKSDGKDPMAKRVCVVQPAITGTLLTKKECKTRAELIAETGVDPLKKK